MLKNIILLEQDDEYQCDTIEEVVKILIDENYYNFTPEEKKEKMKILALANILNNKIEIIKNIDKYTQLDNKFIIQDEMTYILSLLIMNKIILMEKVTSNIFTKELDKSKFEGNYVVVNKFAKELLEKYIRQ